MLNFGDVYVTGFKDEIRIKGAKNPEMVSRIIGAKMSALRPHGERGRGGRERGDREWGGYEEGGAERGVEVKLGKKGKGRRKK
jgi:hypothetical protein